MIKSLTALDLFLIGCYFMAVLYIGWRAGQKESSEGFLIANRQLSAWESAATICASKIGAGLFLTYIAFVYLFGLSAIWSFLGTTAGYILYYFFAGRLKKLADENHYYTLSDYFFQQYGRLSGWASAFTLLIIYVLGFAAQLVGGGKILAALTGSSYWISLTIMTVVILTYTTIGGFKAVVKTDVLQYVAIVVLSIVLTVFLIFNVGRFQFNDLSLVPRTSLALFLGAIIIPFASADLWQRVYATKGQSQMKRSLLYAMVMYLAFGFLLTWMGYIIKGVIVTNNPDIALILGFQKLLPAGLMGFSVVIFYAAIMSTADTNLFISASIAVLDFVGQAKNVKDKSQLVNGVRWAGLLIGTGSFLIAVFFPEMVKIGFLWISLNAGLGLMVIISWVFRSVDDFFLFVGMVTGTLVTLIASFFFTDERLIFVSLVTTPLVVALFFLVKKIGVLRSD
jgi:Na+/proline symporter